MPLPLTLLATTDTFRAWFQLTDNIVSLLNSSVVGDNVVAYGVFTIGANSNTSFSVANNFTVNASAVGFKNANVSVSSNVAVTSNANVFNMAANNFIVQPLQGTIFNSNVTVNAAATFLSPISTNSSVTVNGATALTGTLTVNGAANFTGGSFALRQLTFLSNESVAANTLNNPQYNDFNPTGIANCQVLNLTPNIDAVVTGIIAPTTVAANGAQLLYVQNLSGTYKVTLVSANTSSSANNRIKTPGDLPFEILPGAAATLIWTWTNKEWRTLSSATAVGPQTFANTTINGTLTVTGNTVLANTYLTNLNANGTSTFYDLAATHTASLANTNISGNTSLGANTTYSSVFKYNGAGARLVVPVGTGLWAT